MSVHLSVRLSVFLFAKVVVTKTHERIKIIKYGFFVRKMYTGNRIFQNFPNARRLTKLKPNEIFNDSSISQDPTDRTGSDFLYFKGID